MLLITAEHARKLAEAEARHAEERALLEERQYQEMAELGLLVWACDAMLRKAIAE